MKKIKKKKKKTMKVGAEKTEQKCVPNFPAVDAKDRRHTAELVGKSR